MKSVTNLLGDCGLLGYKVWPFGRMGENAGIGNEFIVLKKKTMHKYSGERSEASRVSVMYSF